MFLLLFSTERFTEIEVRFAYSLSDYTCAIIRKIFG